MTSYNIHRLPCFFIVKFELNIKKLCSVLHTYEVCAVTNYTNPGEKQKVIRDKMTLEETQPGGINIICQ